MYDILGRPVGTLVDAIMEAGRHTVSINANDLPDGIYVVVMQSKGNIRAVKITLAR